MKESTAKKQPLTQQEATARMADLTDWKLSKDGKEISKHYRFKNFVDALNFANKLGVIAEKANHHPDMTLGWGYAGVTYTTHDTGGLGEGDFAMAIKTDEILK